MERYLIAGLGNPDKKYENTRHNAGFHAVDAAAEKLGIVIRTEKFQGRIGEAVRDGKKICFLKPMTYMNLSGNSVKAAADYYDIPADRIIVLVDDINFACGRLRIRPGGSAGGHNGMKSIISCLGTDAFIRIRIGVGSVPQDGDLVSHVLGGFSASDAEVMEREYEKAAEAALFTVERGVSEAMNRYNANV